MRAGCGAAFSFEGDNEEKLAIVQEIRPKAYSSPDADKAIEAILKAVAERHELQALAVVLIEAGTIPKTSSGKIQRRACRENFLNKKFKVIKEWRQNVESASAFSLDSDAHKKVLENIEQFSDGEIDALLDFLSPDSN